MPTELRDVSMAIEELRRMRHLNMDPSHLTRLSTLLRHFELILLDMVEDRLHRR